MLEGKENPVTPEVQKALLSLVKLSFLGMSVGNEGTGFRVDDELYTADHLRHTNTAVLTYTPKHISLPLLDPMSLDSLYDLAIYALPRELKGKMPSLQKTEIIPKDGRVFMLGFPNFSQSDGAAWDLPVAIPANIFYKTSDSIGLMTNDSSPHQEKYAGLSGGPVVTPDGKVVAFVHGYMLGAIEAFTLNAVHPRQLKHP